MRLTTWKECYQWLKQNHYPTYSLPLLATVMWLRGTKLQLKKPENEEPLTLDEQMEAQKELEAHLEAVYERNNQAFLEQARLFRVDNKERIRVPVEVNQMFAGTPMPPKEKGSASETTDPVMQQQVSGVSSNYSLYDDDLEALFNLRNWLQSCLEHGNSKITGGCIGFGGADLVFELDGWQFYVECKPRKNMTDLRKAAEMVIEALINAYDALQDGDSKGCKSILHEQVHALRQALDQLPDATKMIEREWQGLTDEELPEGATHEFDRGVRWAEATLKSKNSF